MFIQRKEPQLRMTTINPGGRIRGWITFEIPEQSKPNKAQFQPNIMDNANVEFELK